jgi:hypothetical protein
MDRNAAAFWLTLVGTVCWGGCFWWMYRISAKQNNLLDNLREQAKRIEDLSRIEHDLIKEVHPKSARLRKVWTRWLLRQRRSRKKILSHRKGRGRISQLFNRVGVRLPSWDNRLSIGQTF